MGLLTNIFIADSKNPPAAEEEPELPDADCLQLKSITSLHLSVLWAIIDAVEWTPDRMDGFTALSESEEGPWLERCPTEFTESLRAAEGSDLSRIGREWAATQEMEGWNPADAGDLVDELINLAWRADSPNRAMYIWASL